MLTGDDMLDSSITGKFISAQRKQLSMTQQDLADKLNLTNKAISKWETGEGYPDISVLPALAEVLNVTVDELLKGEKRDNSQPPVNAYQINESKQQADYILDNSLRSFSNLYLISLGIVLLGIISSALGLRLYDHIFLTSLTYAVIISLSFLIVGMMYYINICHNLKGYINKYNGMMADETVDYNNIIIKKHMLFYAVYLIQVIFFIGIIPLTPLMMPGHYQAFHTLFGYSSIGRFVIDQNFCIIVCLIAYCILLSAGLSVLTRRSVNNKRMST